MLRCSCLQCSFIVFQINTLTALAPDYYPPQCSTITPWWMSLSTQTHFEMYCIQHDVESIVLWDTKMLNLRIAKAYLKSNNFWGVGNAHYNDNECKKSHVKLNWTNTEQAQHEIGVFHRFVMVITNTIEYPKAWNGNARTHKAIVVCCCQIITLVICGLIAT